jgi:hypothetical protein
MPEATTMPAPATTEAGHGWPCCWDGCPRTATHAIRFHNQNGHVHDCDRHTAHLREWSDVAEVVPLPCPFDHGTGNMWIDAPRDLEVGNA